MKLKILTSPLVVKIFNLNVFESARFQIWEFQHPGPMRLGVKIFMLDVFGFSHLQNENLDLQDHVWIKNTFEFFF
jgi:hypothetical protein